MDLDHDLWTILILTSLDSSSLRAKRGRGPVGLCQASAVTSARAFPGRVLLFGAGVDRSEFSERQGGLPWRLFGLMGHTVPGRWAGRRVWVRGLGNRIDAMSGNPGTRPRTVPWRVPSRTCRSLC